MPKSLTVDPKEMRRSGKITFEDIPVNAYQKTVKDERGAFTPQEFSRIYRDMLVIREFGLGAVFAEVHRGLKAGFGFPGGFNTHH